MSTETIIHKETFGGEDYIEGAGAGITRDEKSIIEPEDSGPIYMDEGHTP